MTRKRKLAVAAAAAAAFAVVAGALAAAPKVTIGYPTTGSTISAAQTHSLIASGSVAFVPSTPGTTRLYLRRDGCGTSSDNPHLSITKGTADAGDGCGLVLNAVGPVGDADQLAFVDFPLQGSLPLALDGTRQITGQISLSGPAVGLAEVDVDLAAIVNGQAVDIGSTTGSAVIASTGANTAVPFTIAPATSLDGSDLQALDLRVHIHGPNVLSGFIALNGASYVDLTTYSASVHTAVRVSIDDPSFSHPSSAAVSGSNWRVVLPTPAIGTHTIYARAFQGYSMSSQAASTFTVTS